MTKPFLKWVGGKSQIIEQVINLFPKTIKNYHEPFLGGGSVLIALLNSRDITITGQIFAYDNNPDLINVYQQVKTNPGSVYEQVEWLITEHKKHTNKEQHYYQVRQMYNQDDRNNAQPEQRAAQFLFLNKTCFRGLYRVGPNGFNVPYGHYKTVPSVLERKDALEYSELLQRVTFKCCDFEQALKTVSKGDFVYLDPPYAAETRTSFVGYTKDGFKKHAELFQCCHRLETQGVGFLLSNARVEMVTRQFQDEAVYTIQEIECKRAINSKNPESKTIEVLIYPHFS